MDDNCDLVYFVNSQGEKVTLSSPDNDKYWELVGRSGFTAPNIEIFQNKFASGETRYFGKTKLPRTCKMNMFLRGKSTAERDKMFFDMLEILLDQNGTGEGKLFVKKSDGQMVYLNCVYSSGMDIVEEYKRFHLFSLEFFGADPNFYLDKSQQITSQNLYDYEQYTVQWPSGTSNVYPTSFCDFKMDIYNPSQWDVWPVISLLQSPYIPTTADPTTITNTATGKTISLYGVEDYNRYYYTNAVLTTAPKKRSVMAEKKPDGTLAELFVPAPELLDNDLTSLDFPLVPGKNTLVFEQWNVYDPLGDIDVKIIYNGA